jgi:hypothetical protein
LRHFDNFLKSPPIPKKLEDLKQVNIKIDAQYYSRNDCIVLVKSEKNLIYWKHFERETFQNYLRVFSDLSKMNYKVVSVVSDWHGSLTASIGYIFGDKIPHQRCLIHTQRYCQSFLTQNPKTNAGKELLEIVRQMFRT